METNVLSELKSFQENLNGRLDRVAKRLDSVEAMAQRPVGEGSQPEAKSLAAALWEHAEFKDWTKRGAQGRFTVQLPFEAKTTITSSAVGNSTPGILTPQRIPGIVSPGVQALRVRDIIPRFPTSSNAIEFVKEQAFTNAASPVAETISKPESALTFAIDHEAIRTLATWIPASVQVLDDFVGLRAYIDQRLVDGLLDEMDEQLLAGDGVGAHVAGLIMNCGTYDTTRNAAGDSYLDKLNHAISQIEDSKLRASGIILNPRDWRAIQLQKEEPGGANTGAYLLGGPMSNTVPNLWGLPVATTTAVSVGKFFVGAFQTHTAIWERMDIVVDFSREHADFYIRNLVAIRAECRIALTCTRDDSVLYGSF